MINWEELKDTLYHLIFEEHLSYVEIGSRYSVTGNAIKKAALRLGFELPRKRTINDSETFNKGTIKVPIGICPNCGKEVKLYANRLNSFCDAKCQGEYRHKKNYQKVIEGDPSVMRANYNLKAFKKDILEEQGGICAICGMPPEWNGKPLVFILDHIDGHASNNKRDNLRMICPNCDSLLDTYKSKNKNGDREYHRLNHR